MLVANVRWLSRYRHPRCAGAAMSPRRSWRCSSAAGACSPGRRLAGERLRVLPVLFHLMWRGRLVADLSEVPLGPATLVRTGDRR